MKRAQKYDAFDTFVGKYSAHKVPKWNISSRDVVEYLQLQDEERKAWSQEEES